MEKRVNDRRKNREGLFVVVDGLDGVGKGEVERAIIGFEQKQGRAVLDTVAFSRAHRKGIPEFKDFWDPPETYYDTLSTAEPTYAGIGHNIRNELTSENRRTYSSTDQIHAYSLDRLIQMKRIVIPALAHGLNVIQARCFAATLCYQSVYAQEEGKDPKSVRRYIMQQSGNRLQLENAPDLLIIPTIRDINELINRLSARAKTSKDDNSMFEKLEFQTKIKPLFESTWLRRIFTDAGAKVAYLDAGLSEQDTRRQAIDIYKSYVTTGKVPTRYQTPEFKE